jgi:hypothetical protein
MFISECWYPDVEMAVLFAKFLSRYQLDPHADWPQKGTPGNFIQTYPPPEFPCHSWHCLHVLVIVLIRSSTSTWGIGLEQSAVCRMISTKGHLPWGGHLAPVRPPCPSHAPVNCHHGYARKPVECILLRSCDHSPRLSLILLINSEFLIIVSSFRKSSAARTQLRWCGYPKLSDVCNN